MEENRGGKQEEEMAAMTMRLTEYPEVQQQQQAVQGVADSDYFYRHNSSYPGAIKHQHQDVDPYPTGFPGADWNHSVFNEDSDDLHSLYTSQTGVIHHTTNQQEIRPQAQVYHPLTACHNNFSPCPVTNQNLYPLQQEEGEKDSPMNSVPCSSQMPEPLHQNVQLSDHDTPFEPQSQVPVLLLGRDILSEMPGKLHFIRGCANFFPLDNKQFMAIVRKHFERRLQDKDFKNIIYGKNGKVEYKVVGEVEAILDTAKRAELPGHRNHVRQSDVVIWELNNKTDKLQKKTWENLQFKNVSSSDALREKAPSAPSRGTIEALHGSHQ